MLRQKMVEREVLGRGVTDPRVVEAMRRLPRHLFVDEALRGRAYTDQPLPIGSKQTISRPHTVALMTELLAPEADQRVLEIGTGSGYQAAVLASLARHVDTVERHPSLARRARRILGELGLRNVRVWERDGTLGLPGQPPYARIMVTAGSPATPRALLEQLAEGGRLVVPVATRGGGELLQVIEREGDRLRVMRSVTCAFVPLIGADGYADPP
jgi:protein-L-isoaspartate(D-aspartate) O-methyltransferase